MATAAHGSLCSIFFILERIKLLVIGKIEKEGFIEKREMEGWSALPGNVFGKFEDRFEKIKEFLYPTCQIAHVSVR